MWTVPPLLIVLVAAAYPLLRVCLESTKVGDTQRGWSIWSEVLASPMFRDALWRTVSIAVTSTAGCLVLGMFLAIVLAFVPFPGSRVVGRLIDTVLALPSFLITLAFTFLYGSAGAVNAAISSLTGATSSALNFLYTPVGVIAAEITFSRRSSCGRCSRPSLCCLARSSTSPPASVPHRYACCARSSCQRRGRR